MKGVETMQIRLMNEEDMDAVISLWLAASEQAHHFIDGAYWQSKQEDMRSVYLPMAESYVLENEGEIAGFISVVQHLLAALFVHPDHQGKGYGRALMEYVKERVPKLELKVYKDNENAIHFYERQGFSVLEETVDEETGQAEFVMGWQASSCS
ncbi:N-acetyltransferase [Paenibacillus sp. FSL M7-1455]|uniref:N-acetyltransferase n=1 Tax=Paenibacillus sp. FSL M7-1455 TaxID=2975316 RepID=UPI0030F8412D